MSCFKVAVRVSSYSPNTDSFIFTGPVDLLTKFPDFPYKAFAWA